MSTEFKKKKATSGRNGRIKMLFINITCSSSQYQYYRGQLHKHSRYVKTVS